jgi:hypothetical protein
MAAFLQSWYEVLREEARRAGHEYVHALLLLHVDSGFFDPGVGGVDAHVGCSES